jgi:hypothetical protein
MGSSYFASASERKAHERWVQQQNNKEAARIENERRKLAAKIVMAVVDKVVAEIVRPGPKPEERECYVMAGELRAIVPDLEELAKKIIDVNHGVA